MKKFLKKLIKWTLILVVILFIFSLFVDDDEYNTEVTSPKLTKRMHSSNLIKEKQVKLDSSSTEKVSVFIYMNGSDLESNDGEATTDIKEMIKATDNDNVNIVIQTMGTKSWKSDLGIDSSKSQRYVVDKDHLKLVDNSLPQLDCTKSDTLRDFIKWGAKNYPADRNILIFWNHGAGPVYGYGYDEHQSVEESLTIDEIQSALKDGGVYFDFIGMDCCLMSSLELCCAIYDYCDYTILSEDFESGYGWEYTSWLTELANNPKISTPDLAKVIIDNMVKVNESNSDGSSSTLALIDLSYIKPLYIAWVDFAYKNESALLENNYSQHVKGGTRSIIDRKYKGFFSDWLSNIFGEENTMQDFYVTDLMAVASNIDSEESKVLQSALSNALTYYKATDDEKALTGMSVTLPYGDSEFYNQLKTVFLNCGFDGEYVNWLSKFVDGDYEEDSFYDYDEWSEEWDGWNDYDYYYDDDDWFSWLDEHDFEDDEYDWDWDDWDYEDDYDDEDWFDILFDWF